MTKLIERLEALAKGFIGYPSGCRQALAYKEAAARLRKLEAVREAAIAYRKKQKAIYGDLLDDALAACGDE